ncbi:AMP-binding protein [Pseudomonas shirazensis]|uniref:AMP-binding protein n=1 Tax=Pseudomonas shirazensis TaxID=2745494 RepID=UPI003D2A7DEA
MNAEQVFHTSGSSGAPRQWLRSRAQMEQEALLIYLRWAPQVSEIISFAPVSHSYGQILGETGARVSAAALQLCSFEQQQLPTLDGHGQCVILAIASTWKLLPALLKRLAGKRPLLIVHSASMLPPGALAVVQQFASAQVRFIEVLGSTETGAIAVRELDASSTPEQPWNLLEDVQLLTPAGQPAPLEIASPRIARELGQACAAPSHRCDDLVQVVGPRRVRWLGRVSSLIKVNGVRLDLARLGAELGVLVGCSSLVCVQLRDGLRGEAYSILLADPLVSAGDVLDAFAQLTPGTPRPLHIRHIDHLPLSATGKPQAWAAASTVKEYTDVTR